MKEIVLLEAKVFNGNVFPLTLSSVDCSLCALTDWLQNNRNDLDDKLLLHKGILLRGFGVQSAQDFHEVIISTGYASMEYIGGAAVRTQLTDRVFTANESPSSEKIPFHHEMAQTPRPPTHLLFYCEKEPTEGGETPILISSLICHEMRRKFPEFMEKVETLGLKYVRYLPEDDDATSAIGRGWKSTFLTNSREGAEEALKLLGSSWEWQDDGTLKTVTATLPGVRMDSGLRRTNEPAFFNSMVAAFTGWNDSRNIGEKAILFGDGSFCPPDVIAAAAALMDEVAVAFKWRSGDILILDNRTTMHARRPFTGPRRILASIVHDPSR